MKMSKQTRRQAIFVMVFLVVVIFFAVTFRMAVVKGDSMLPTFKNGQIVLVNRLYNLTGGLRRGDVVLVKKDHDILIKRLAYLPGDIIKGKSAIAFWTVSEFFDIPPTHNNGIMQDMFDLRVPKDFIVVLGDNPDVSDDSRIFGPIPFANVVGRVIYSPAKR